MYAAGITDVGVLRTQNQDAIFFSRDKVGPLPNLFVVADGMGGHNAGDVASIQALEVFTSYIRDYPLPELVLPADYLDMMVTAATRANHAVFSHSQKYDSLTGMGTTLTACIIESNKAVIVHVGDSRMYGIKPGGINQLTSDHSFVEEMIQLGQLTAEEAKVHPKRHMLTRVLGTDATLQVDGIIRDLAGCTALLLCSDGLTNMVTNERILEIINNPGYVEHRTQNLINEANQNGGRDNISAILIDIGR